MATVVKKANKSATERKRKQQGSYVEIAKKEFSWKRPAKSLGRWTMQGNKQMNVRPTADQQDCGLYFSGHEFCFYIKNENTGLQCCVTNVCSFGV